MTRITESQIGASLVSYINNNRSIIDRLNKEISTGIKVSQPGDSSLAGTIAQFQQAIEKSDTYKNRTASINDLLNFQENVLNQVNTLLIRAKEVATQAANETNSATARAQMAAEVLQIRDHVASLANSTYQGRYIYGGIDDNDPPYDAATYTNYTSSAAGQRYVYDSDTGSTSTRTVNITDNLTIVTNTPGSSLFDNAIQGLERLGRALEGYATTPLTDSSAVPPSYPDPTGAGNAYTFPTDYTTQTAAIREAMNQLDYARQNEIAPERTDIAGRQERMKTAESLLALAKNSALEALDHYQNSDTVAAATELTQAQTALQASLSVSVKVLGLNILNYI